MKSLLVFLLAFIFNGKISSQEVFTQEYSYTEFFKLIAEEKDTVFILRDALIKYDPRTDSRFKDAFTGKGEKLYNPQEKIVIDKRIELDNVQFLADIYNENNEGWTDGTIKDFHFKKDLILKNVYSINFGSCQFDGNLDIDIMNCNTEGIDPLAASYISIRNSKLNNLAVFQNCINSSDLRSWIAFLNNEIGSPEARNRVQLGFINSRSFQFWDNQITALAGISIFCETQDETFSLRRNNFISDEIVLTLQNLSSKINITENKFSSYVKFEVDQLKAKDEIDWNQFRHKLIYSSSFYAFAYDKTKTNYWRLDSSEQANFTQSYLDSIRYHSKSAFVNEIGMKALFYDYYRSKYDIETANEVYLELKDFETQRMALRYQLDPSFKTYFTWKVNQFLKVFSAYGTEPARAIVVSLYVILFFAMIYLFFPNTWDEHGSMRIMNRFRFFTKYMNKEAGIHEVYLEEQEKELLASEDFKNYMLSMENSVPKFFLAAAIPLYKWSVAGTNLSASLLKRVDIMKGSWQDLPENKRRWKKWLLIISFIIAVVYDLFIKVLNALMLSINTFTTLGFGEIPIKGLPRYLAIIQGFIGWFMLTIFSVSLISQLLN